MKTFEYNDALYGKIRLPDYLEPFFSTKLANRARGITMGTVPNVYRTNGYLPSRFHHGVGSAYLASLVVKKNPRLSEVQQKLIVVSALMHDWGNPPFAHLMERFLLKIANHNGETFLGELLGQDIGSDTRTALKSIGVKPQDVVSMVTGQMKPFSDVVSGSIDVDNLDNIYRFKLCIGSYYPVVDTVSEKISRALRWQDGSWSLQYHPGLFDHLRFWKEARREVYDNAYSSPHIIVSWMLSSALWKLYQRSQLKYHHFSLTDNEILDLLQRHQPEPFPAIDNWQWHQPVFQHFTTTPSPTMTTLKGGLLEMINKASQFAEFAEIKQEQVSLYAGSDKMEREITLPIFDGDNLVPKEELPNSLQPRPTNYRVQINVCPSLIDHKLVDKALAFAKENLL